VVALVRVKWKCFHLHKIRPKTRGFKKIRPRNEWRDNDGMAAAHNSGTTEIFLSQWSTVNLFYSKFFRRGFIEKDILFFDFRERKLTVAGKKNYQLNRSEK
jgi:hypothetical protein